MPGPDNTLPGPDNTHGGRGPFADFRALSIAAVAFVFGAAIWYVTMR